MEKFIRHDRQFMMTDRRMLSFHVDKAHLSNTPMNPVACLFNDEKEFLMRYAIYNPSYSYISLYHKYIQEVDINDLFARCTFEDEWMADFMLCYPDSIDFSHVYEVFICYHWLWAKKVIIEGPIDTLPEYVYEMVDETKDHIYYLCDEIAQKKPEALDWARITSISFQSTFWRDILLKNMNRVVPSEIIINNQMRPFILKYKKQVNLNSINWDYIEIFDDYTTGWLSQVFFERIDSLDDETWKELHRFAWSGPLFRERPDKFNISIIESTTNTYHRNTNAFAKNPLLRNVMFTYDYRAIRERNHEINNSVIAWFYSPEKINTWISDGNNIEDYVV